MMTNLLALAVAAMPLGAVLALLRLADRMERRREAGYARQIELTDAIHREMGAAAAPIVKRRRGGGWLVRMTVPLDKPAVVAEILGITHEVFASAGTEDAVQIALTPRPAPSAPVADPLR